MPVRWEPLSNGVEIAVSPPHHFGADALLLAAFARPQKQDNVCDLGTGCGVIPFWWLSRGLLRHADGVDISPEAIALAQQSLQHNHGEDSLSFLCGDWDKLTDVLPQGVYDLVTCNPPYFPPGSGGVSADPMQRRIRHEPDDAMLNRLCRSAGRLLKNGGRFALCHRPERLCDVLLALRSSGLEPKRLQLVHNRAETAPWLFLCESRKGGKPGLSILPPLLPASPDAFTDSKNN